MQKQKMMSISLGLCCLVLASAIAPLVSQAATKTAPQHPRATPTPVPTPAPTPVAVSNDGFWRGFGIGLVAGYVDYKEPGLMREYGKLYGVNATFASLNEVSNLSYNVEGELVAGRLLYDGGTQDFNTGAITPFTTGTNDYIFNLRGTVGLYRVMSPSWAITPYIGLGYRDLNDKMDGSGSYNRNISYLYLPIGGQIAGWLSDKNSFSFSADLDVVISGTVISKLSDVDSSAPDITNHNSGLGYRLTTSFRHDFGGWTGHLQPFYQKWKMNKSDGVSLLISSGGTTQQATLFEPTNESDFIGLNIGADF